MQGSRHNPTEAITVTDLETRSAYVINAACGITPRFFDSNPSVRAGPQQLSAAELEPNAGARFNKMTKGVNKVW